MYPIISFERIAQFLFNAAIILMDGLRPGERRRGLVDSSRLKIRGVPVF